MHTKLTQLFAGLLFLPQLAVLPSAAQESPPPVKLEIVVVEGEGAINNVRQRSAHEPIVRVEDENQRPVAGAAVVFTLPTQGPSGEFGNGSQNITIITDSQGLAAARGLKINGVGGKLQLHVNASYRGRTARIVITQFNMSVSGAAKSGGGGKIIAILALVGAAAAGGAVAATRKSASSSPSTTPTPTVVPITITPGTGSMGPPR